jgi:predicted phage terminase large subunit-like protein
MEYTELRRTAINLAARDRPQAILIEDKGSGTSLLQDLRANTSLPVIAIEPVGDKIFRAGEVSPIVESGRLLLPHPGSVSWLADYESELLGFPNAVSYRDQVDETTQFLKWVQRQGGEYSFATSNKKLVSHQNVTVKSQASRGFGSVTRPKVNGA